MAGKARGSVGRGFAGLATGLVLSVMLAGCGDTEVAGQPEKEVRDYCAKSLAIETFPEPDIDFRTATPEQMTAAVRSYASRLIPLAEQVQAAAPAEVRKDIDLLVGAVRQLAQTGDFEAAFETPEADAAEARSHAFDLDNCKWTKVDVSGNDYSFTGVPQKLKTGPVSFEFKNIGKEPHELLLLRVNDGVSESVAQIVALPEEQGRAKVAEVGGTFAPPGKGDYKVADLKPGRYGFACFVPVGGGEQGPPHTTKGMFAEFEVA